MCVQCDKGNVVVGGSQEVDYQLKCCHHLFSIDES